MELFRGRRANFQSDPHDNLHREESRRTTDADFVRPGLTPEELRELGMRHVEPGEHSEPLGPGTLPGEREPEPEPEPEPMPLDVDNDVPNEDERPEYPVWNPNVMGRDGYEVNNRIERLSGMVGPYEKYKLSTKVTDTTSFVESLPFTIHHLQNWMCWNIFSATKEEYENHVRMDVEATANLNRAVAMKIDKNADKMIDRFVVKDRKTMVINQKVRVNDNAQKNKDELALMIARNAVRKAKAFRALPPKWSQASILDQRDRA